MYSSLNDYLSSPDPELVEKGVLLFAHDYGLDDTIEEIWSSVFLGPILGLENSLEKDGKIYYCSELEFPNHELRVFRIEEDNKLAFVREQRIDNARERKEALDLRMTKRELNNSIQKRLAVKHWAKLSLKKFMTKVIAWHKIDL